MFHNFNHIIRLLHKLPQLPFFIFIIYVFMKFLLIFFGKQFTIWNYWEIYFVNLLISYYFYMNCVQSKEFQSFIFCLPIHWLFLLLYQLLLPNFFFISLVNDLYHFFGRKALKKLFHNSADDVCNVCYHILLKKAMLYFFFDIKPPYHFEYFFYFNIMLNLCLMLILYANECKVEKSKLQYHDIIILYWRFRINCMVCMIIKHVNTNISLLFSIHLLIYLIKLN